MVCRKHPHREGDHRGPVGRAGAANLGDTLLHLIALPSFESTDIAAQNPKVVQQIEQILAKSRTEAATPPTDPRIWEKYREDTKRLDALLSS